MRYYDEMNKNKIDIFKHLILFLNEFINYILDSFLDIDCLMLFSYYSQYIIITVNCILFSKINKIFNK